MRVASQPSVVIRTRFSMADDIVQRVWDHLEPTLDRVVDEQREVPELTKVRAKDLPEVKVHGMKVEHVEIDCDLCDHMAVGPYEDGWETPEQSLHSCRETLHSARL